MFTEDRERIVDCVNACAGIEDPVTTVPQLVGALREIAGFDPTKLDAATLGNIARKTLAKVQL